MRVASVRHWIVPASPAHSSRYVPHSVRRTHVATPRTTQLTTHELVIGHVHVAVQVWTVRFRILIRAVRFVCSVLRGKNFSCLEIAIEYECLVVVFLWTSWPRRFTATWLSRRGRLLRNLTFDCSLGSGGATSAAIRTCSGGTTSAATVGLDSATSVVPGALSLLLDCST